MNHAPIAVCARSTFANGQDHPVRPLDEGGRREVLCSLSVTGGMIECETAGEQGKTASGITWRIPPQEQPQSYLPILKESRKRSSPQTNGITRDSAFDTLSNA